MLRFLSVIHPGHARHLRALRASVQPGARIISAQTQAACADTPVCASDTSVVRRFRAPDGSRLEMAIADESPPVLGPRMLDALALTLRERLWPQHEATTSEGGEWDGETKVPTQRVLVSVTTDAKVVAAARDDARKYPDSCANRYFLTTDSGCMVMARIFGADRR